MRKLKVNSDELVDHARSDVGEIGTPEAIEMFCDPDLVIVDIRDVRERQRKGYIPGSVHRPRGMIEFWVDPECPYFKKIFDHTDKMFLFHCASGWRSALTLPSLQKMGFESSHLKDGFSSWEAAGGLVEFSEVKPDK